MPNEANTATLISLLKADEVGILTAWVDQQLAGASFRSDRISRKEVAAESQRFLGLFRDAIGQSVDVQSPAWSASRQALEELSSTRAQQGFTSSETATFVFSLKQILFDRLRAELAARPVEFADATWTTSTLLDKLGLYTTDVYLRTREQVIVRQQQEMLELSTPVVTLWDGVLALPLIGTLDSARTQVVMESLLQRIVDSGALIAIIDITGVPTVDTLTAQHLLKTIAAARLMGADCIISGIRPQIAQTIVHLGVELGSVVTKATLADAFAVALRRSGLTVAKIGTAPRRTSAPREADAGSEHED